MKSLTFHHGVFMFEWNPEQQDKVVPGLTIRVEGSPHYENGRYTVTGKLKGFILIKVNGVGASVPWHRCNPNSIELES